MFPELRPYLDAVRRQAADGETFVITRYRDTNANLRTQLLRIIAAAGLSPWPKLFHNCRASRDGTGDRASVARRLRMDRQFGRGGGQALSARDGRRLRAGGGRR
jgi:hypothetical protein